ncbi:MAG: prepilin-type N-terminal cleavage/methylation domain-containing protein [Planctomycetota bacterium]
MTNPFRHTTSVQRWSFRTRPAGMTLIELLVVIVILVTLVAGVIPILSPNNDARKLREASRQLSSMISQAQATAARTGRPAGIGFNGVDPNTGAPRGIALEAYFFAQPPAFHGFDDRATVRLQPAGSTPQVTLQFGAGRGDSFVSDGSDQSYWLPPRMFRLGDEIVVAGHRFRIVEGGANEIEEFNTQDIYGNSIANEYLISKQVVDVVWMNWHLNADRRLPDGGHRYEVLRKPQRTSEPPLAFPRGIGIDTTASEGDGTFGWVSVLFHPNGQVEGFYHNGEKDTQSRRIDLLLGRVENAKVLWPEDNANFDASQFEQFNFIGASPEQVEQGRDEINWLNSESRWLRIMTRSGRAIIAENAFFDPSDPNVMESVDESLDGEAQFDEQLDLAREFLDSMLRSGGNQ